MNFKIPENIIIAFLQDNFGELKFTSTGEIRINSPFTNDRKFHMYINPDKGAVYDFKTSSGLSFISFVSNYLEIGIQASLSYLIKNYSGRNSLNDFSINDYIETSHELIIPEGLSWFSESETGLIRRQAYHYLIKRNISLEVIDDLGYIYEPGSEYDKMIFIPFYEENKLVYYICRDFTGKNYLRYNFPHDLNSKKFVYNIDKIEEEIFIFEGVFDAFMLKNQIGTAMLSADLGKEQIIKILNKAPKTIIFVPDNDETGKTTLDKNIKLLLKYKPPSLDLNILIYKIKEEVKDFSETGENYINIEKCKKWQKLNLENVVETIFRS